MLKALALILTIYIFSPFANAKVVFDVGEVFDKSIGDSDSVATVTKEEIEQLHEKNLNVDVKCQYQDSRGLVYRIVCFGPPHISLNEIVVHFEEDVIDKESFSSHKEDTIEALADWGYKVDKCVPHQSRGFASGLICFGH